MGVPCFVHRSVLRKTQRRTHERKRSEAQGAGAALRQPLHQPVCRLSGVHLPVGLRGGSAGLAGGAVGTVRGGLAGVGVPGVCGHAPAEKEAAVKDPERPAEPLEEEAERCAVCGAAWPEYQVQEPGRGVIGCESCLVIRKGGAIQ